MAALITAVVLAALALTGFWVGVRAARASRLDKKERAELNELRSLVTEMTTTAVEYSSSGDLTGRVFLDMMTQSARTIHQLKGGEK